ncbi:MAG TPA: serine--tRNA ligase, partial [bacterium]|nr:serine--tRNA ligase [bacterium]
MFPVKFVRENMDFLKKAAEEKNISVDWDTFQIYEQKRRDIVQHLDEQKRQHNQLNQELAILKKKNDNPGNLLIQAKELSASIKNLEVELKEIEEKIEDILASIPNIPHQSVPVGKGPEDNVVVKSYGERKLFPFEVMPHYEIGQKLNILHLDKGARMSGSFFPVFSGAGARLVRALINFMLDLHIANGYKEIWPPSIVNRKSMFGTGQLPRLEEDMYRLKDEEMFLIPTAEVPVTNFHREETISEEYLPLKYCAYTPCFRREAGAYGKDTKGLIRLHQFDKVELVIFCKPEFSYNEHEILLKEAEKVLQMLELPYRVVLLCTADMSFAAAKCYDIEVWAPGVNKWLEVSSCSNFEAFQARRAQI